MILFISVIVWLLTAFKLMRAQHYYFGIVWGLVGVYEFSGIIYLTYFDINHLSPDLYNVVGAYVTAENLFKYTLYIDSFLLVMFFTYRLFTRRWSTSAVKLPRTLSEGNFGLLITFLLVLGLISNYTSSGLARVADYGNADFLDLKQHSAIFYGRALLVSIVGVAMYSVTRRNSFNFALILAAMSPIVYELFVSGRRQSFFPSLILILLYLMYRTELRHRLAIIVGTVSTVLAVMLAQFYLRGSMYFDSTSLLRSVLYPFGELAAISFTGFMAVCSTTSDSISYGAHLVSGFLNSFPVIKSGDMFLSFVGLDGWAYDAAVISPKGGLSMVADAHLGFYMAAPLLLGLTIGSACAFFHKLCRIYLRESFILTYWGLLSLSIGATVIAQYRNGLADAIKALVAITLLFLFANIIQMLASIKLFAGAFPRAK